MVITPPAPHDQGRRAKLELIVGEGIRAGISWIIDERGEKVVETLLAEDQYLQNLDKLPDPGAFRLSDSPPVVHHSTASE